MKAFITLIVLFLVVGTGYYFYINNAQDRANGVGDSDSAASMEDGDAMKASLPQVTPISHATFVLEWGEVVLYNDPTGGAEAFEGQPVADIVLVSDIHGDHLNMDTLEAVVGPDTVLVVPQAVADELSESLLSFTSVLSNGETMTVDGITIEALPMYNLPEAPDNRHAKGRGNGYVLESEGARVYIAGDTQGTPEMRALTGIDMAFVPMNLPYTMDVTEAADAVADFAPVRVYPYHYRGQEGLSDVQQFSDLVRTEDPNIEVILLDWYPS